MSLSSSGRFFALTAVLFLSATAIGDEPQTEKKAIEYDRLLPASLCFQANDTKLAAQFQLTDDQYPVGYSLRAWDIKTATPLGELTEETSLFDISAVPSPNEDEFVLLDSGKTPSVTLRRISSGEIIRKMEVTDGAAFSDVGFSRDGLVLAGVYTVSDETSHCRRLRLWNSVTGNVMTSIPAQCRERDLMTMIRQPELSYDKKTLAFVTENSDADRTIIDTNISVLDVSTGLQISRIVMDKKTIGAYALSPDGTELTTAETRNFSVFELTFWDATTGKLKSTIDGKDVPHSLNSFLRYMSDGKTIISAGDGYREGMGQVCDIRLFDGKTHQLKRIYYVKALGGNFVCAALSSDDKKVAIGFSDGSIQIRDLSNGSLIQQFAVEQPAAHK